METLTGAIRALPSDETEVFIGHLGGAMSRIPRDATAFPQRDTHFVMNVHTRWREASEDETCIRWARDLFDRMAPHAAGTAYINFMPEDDGDRIETAYGANFKRLKEIKARYDPANVFRVNQNIRPDK